MNSPKVRTRKSLFENLHEGRSSLGNKAIVDKSIEKPAVSPKASSPILRKKSNEIYYTEGN
jgi:hypothetical protein|tara:strand:- start:124 stop:306 length:183 start_codon:yes stop_codon:yes gene_type:complete